MKTHEFTKYEIATYLRDYNRLMTYALLNQDIPFYEVFKHHMSNDKRIQYSIKDYYYEMISVYELLLTSKFLTMLYDNYFEYLLDTNINGLNIPANIFVNTKDRSSFSKKQIIINIRNAFNHNDNPNHDLLKIVRVNENGKDVLKAEIMLKNTKPIPFHVILDIEQLMTICFEIKNASTILIASNRSIRPISLNSSNVNETLDNIYLRKFYSRKKLSDEQKELLVSNLNNSKETKNKESLLLANGMEYKDFKYSIAQKVKVEEDLKYWESIGVSGNDVIGHLLSKVMPLSYMRDRVFTMNLILSNYYIRDGNKSIFDLVKDARKVFNSKICDMDSPLYLYSKSFGIDDNILFDAIDFENLASITNAIYYGFLFDTLIMDQDIKISDNRTIIREKIRDSFVHMRWFKGINECFKLYDWEKGIDNEYNSSAKGFWKTNIRYTDMERCAETYFHSNINNRQQNASYMDLPIHFKREFNKDGTSKVVSITFIKDGVFYYLNLLNGNSNYELLVCDDSQIQRPANIKEINIFINELDYLTEDEKNKFSETIKNIKEYLLQFQIMGISK